MYVTVALDRLPSSWEIMPIIKTTPGGKEISVIRVRLPAVGWIESTTDTALCFDNKRGMNMRYRAILDSHRVPYIRR